MYISASAPDAPPLRDTTIGCFIRLFFWMADCIILAIWSEAPPAPAATTISTGLVGSHAQAGVVAINARPARALAATTDLHNLPCMISSFSLLKRFRRFPQNLPRVIAEHGVHISGLEPVIMGLPRVLGLDRADCAGRARHELQL